MRCSHYVCAALFIFCLMVTTSYKGVRRLGFSHTHSTRARGEAADLLERAAEGLGNI